MDDDLFDDIDFDDLEPKGDNFKKDDRGIDDFGFEDEGKYDTKNRTNRNYEQRNSDVNEDIYDDIDGIGNPGNKKDINDSSQKKDERLPDIPNGKHNDNKKNKNDNDDDMLDDFDDYEDNRDNKRKSNHSQPVNDNDSDKKESYSKGEDELDLGDDWGQSEPENNFHDQSNDQKGQRDSIGLDQKSQRGSIGLDQKGQRGSIGIPEPAKTPDLELNDEWDDDESGNGVIEQHQQKGDDGVLRLNSDYNGNARRQSTLKQQKTKKDSNLRLDSNWDKKPKINKRESLKEDMYVDAGWGEEDDDFFNEDNSKNNSLIDPKSHMSVAEPKPFPHVDVPDDLINKSLVSGNSGQNIPFGKIKGGDNRSSVDSQHNRKSAPFGKVDLTKKKNSTSELKMEKSEKQPTKKDSRVKEDKFYSQIPEEPLDNFEEDLGDLDSMPESDRQSSQKNGGFTEDFDEEEFDDGNEKFEEEELVDDQSNKGGFEEEELFDEPTPEDFDNGKRSSTKKVSMQDDQQNIRASMKKKAPGPSKQPEMPGHKDTNKKASPVKKKSYKPDLFKKNDRSSVLSNNTKERVKKSRSRPQSNIEQKTPKSNNFGAYYRSKNPNNSSLCSTTEEKTLLTNKMKKNYSEGGIKFNHTRDKATLENVKYFLDNEWDEPFDLLKLYKRNAIMHNYIRDMNDELNVMINKEKIKLISGRTHFKPRVMDNKILDRELANYKKFIEVLTDEIRTLDKDIRRAADPKYQVHLNEQIYDLTERNKRNAKEVIATKMKSEQISRNIENMVRNKGEEELHAQEVKKMQMAVRDLNEHKAKQAKLKRDIEKLQEKEEKFEGLFKTANEEIRKIREEAKGVGCSLNSKLDKRIDACFEEVGKAERAVAAQRGYQKGQIEHIENDINELTQTNEKMQNLYQNAEEQTEKQEEIISYVAGSDPICKERVEEWANRSKFYCWDRERHSDKSEDVKSMARSGWNVHHSQSGDHARSRTQSRQQLDAAYDKNVKARNKLPAVPTFQHPSNFSKIINLEPKVREKVGSQSDLDRNRSNNNRKGRRSASPKNERTASKYSKKPNRGGIPKKSEQSRSRSNRQSKEINVRKELNKSNQVDVRKSIQLNPRVSKDFVIF